jgi:hypothetical protein
MTDPEQHAESTRVPGCECDPNAYMRDNGCIQGTWYGYCESDLCGGMCEPTGTCPCPCHKAPVIDGSPHAE